MSMRTGGLRVAVRWFAHIASWVVMLAAGAMLLLGLLVPRVAGATPFVIETGSMRPAMPPGTLVVAKPADPGSIAIGDVITYQVRSGDPTVVTHRVVTIGYDATGQPRWQTRGDANTVVDPGWVIPDQVRGVRWYYVPYLGYATSYLTGNQRQVLTWLVALSLLGYAGRMFLGAARDRRRSKAPALPNQRPVPVATYEAVDEQSRELTSSGGGSR